MWSISNTVWFSVQHNFCLANQIYQLSTGQCGQSIYDGKRYFRVRIFNDPARGVSHLMKKTKIIRSKIDTFLMKDNVTKSHLPLVIQTQYKCKWTYRLRWCPQLTRKACSRTYSCWRLTVMWTGCRRLIPHVYSLRRTQPVWELNVSLLFCSENRRVITPIKCNQLSPYCSISLPSSSWKYFVKSLYSFH